MTNDTEPERASLLLTIAEAARMLAVGRTTLYNLIDRGELETVLIGRARRVPIAAVAGFVGRLRQNS
jgi:excisionase family DNA binding protein